MANLEAGVRTKLQLHCRMKNLNRAPVSQDVSHHFPFNL